ncbi:MAG: hypothetical protein IPO08_22420 [Xanthomonadales bacterium]|nr:hypothetical protein [Xanthomonadales bacterium]
MNKLQSALRSDHDASRSERIANAYDDMMADYARPAKRVVMTSVNTAAKQITTVDPAWLCHLCGIQQPAWAGDCLTCETLPMMGDRD